MITSAGVDSSPTAVIDVPDEVQAATRVGGRYELREVVGRGGMSTVYAALDRHTGGLVAVKVFRPGVELTDSPARRHREVELASTLRHPGVVAVLDAQVDDCDRADGCAYLVTELVDGPTLGQRIKLAALTEQQAIELGVALCGILAYVHAAGIVHRDIKPANVLLPRGDEGLLHPKLTDFGIAMMTDSTRVTETGFTAGTANYLSPEQVLGQPITAASDVYSLGLVLIESLSGDTVFPGRGIEAALARLNNDPQPPQWISSGLGELLQHMTARDPHVRPSADLARRRLRRLTGEGLLSDIFALDVTSTTAPSVRTRFLATKRHRRGAVVTGIIAAGTLATALVITSGPSSGAGTAATTGPSISSTTLSPVSNGTRSPGSVPSAAAAPLGSATGGPPAGTIPVVPDSVAPPINPTNAVVVNANAPVTSAPASIPRPHGHGKTKNKQGSGPNQGDGGN